LSKQVSSPEGVLTIVREVSFEIAAGESIAVVGASGAGKSTLLALLAGLDTPSSGEVWLAGQNLARLDEDGRARLRAQRVGFVFQSFHLIPSLTALENVMLPLGLARQNLARLDEDGRARLRAQRVGFVFQSFHLIPSLTALENVMLPLELAGRRDARSAALETLQRVGLQSRVGHYPRQLSGGEQQRV